VVYAVAVVLRHSTQHSIFEHKALPTLSITTLRITVLSTKSRFAEFCYAECRVLFISMLNVVMLSLAMMNVIALSVMAPYSGSFIALCCGNIKKMGECLNYVNRVSDQFLLISELASLNPGNRMVSSKNFHFKVFEKKKMSILVLRKSLFGNGSSQQQISPWEST